MKIVHGYLGRWYVHIDGVDADEIAVLHYRSSYLPHLPPQPGDAYHQPIGQNRRFNEVLTRKRWEADRINETGLVVLSHDKLIEKNGERQMKRYKPPGERSPYAGLWKASKAAVPAAKRMMTRFDGDLVFADYELTFTLGEKIDDLIRPCDRR
jgi:hypothetical protein